MDHEKMSKKDEKIAELRELNKGGRVRVIGLAIRLSFLVHLVRGLLKES